MTGGRIVNVSLHSPARLIALAVHAVTSEYRKLDPPPPVQPDSQPARTEINNTAASTQQAWQPVHRAPAAARAFGFGPMSDPQPDPREVGT